MLQSFFSKKDTHFIPLLNELAELISYAGKELFELVKSSSVEATREKRATIGRLEHEGDEIVRKILQKLYKTFFAPFDHEDIKDLAQSLDDILDEIDAVANLIVLYKLTDSKPYIAPFSITIKDATAEVVRLVGSIQQGEIIREVFQKLDEIEHNGDELLNKALLELFERESNTLKILQHKEVYERLEMITDRCKDTSDITEAIVLKYL